MTSAEEFREFGKVMIDYVVDYLENIRDREVNTNPSKCFMIIFKSENTI